jgi:hypothetical protein
MLTMRSSKGRLGMRYIALLLAHPLQVVVLFGFSFAGCSWSPGAQSATHIDIARDVMIEAGVSITPHSITRTGHGGYVITGAIAENHAWATRLNSALGVMWRVEEPQRSVGAARDTSTYDDAVVLPDDSVLLCGVTQVGPRGITGVGLLTHMGAAGQVIQRRELPLPDDYTLTANTKCVGTRDGALMIGIGVVGKGANEPLEYRTWIVALDQEGVFRWQKLVPVAPPSQIIWQAIELPNRNIAIYGDGYCLEFDAQGVPMSQRQLQRSLGRPILSWKVPALAEAAVPGDAGGPETVDDRINARPGLQIGDKSLQAHFQARFAYALPDGGLALFGNKEKDNVYSAAIVYVSPDLKTTEVHLMGERDDAASWLVADVTPTGVAGEFATVRFIAHFTKATGPDPLMGIGLAFVRLR